LAKRTYRPTASPVVDLPAAVFGGTDNFLAVVSILSDQDYGIFHRPGLLVDAMMQDDRILSVSQRRCSAPFNVPLSMLPAGDGAKRKRIADFLLPESGNGGKFWEYFPQETLEQIIFWGLWVGVVAVQKLWDTSQTPWAPKLKVWHPQFLYWNWGDRRYHLITANGTVVLPQPDELHEEWAIWQPFGEYGWRRAMVRALAFSYLEKRWGKRDWARYNQIHGIPTRKAITPQGAPAGDRKAYFRAIANLGNEPTVEVPKGDKDKAGYDFELVEAVAKTYETFRDHRETVNKDIAIALLGENLTTDSGGTGAPGSFSQAKTQQDVSQDRVKRDVKIYGWLRKHFIMPWAANVYGDPELAPIPSPEVDPPEDDNARTLVLTQLGTAVQQLKAGFGDRIDEDALAERFEVPLRMTKDEWDAIAPDPMDDAGGPGGDDGDGGGGSDGGGGQDDKNDAADKAAMAILSAVQASEHYPDRLRANASPLMARALARHRVAILKACKAAGSPQAVREALARCFRKFDPAPAAEVIKRARLMTYMAGRLTAHREVTK